MAKLVENVKTACCHSERSEESPCSKRLYGILRFAQDDKRTIHSIKARLRHYKLHTVCEEARCPNLGECFTRGTATFMILGNVCTRSCKFCNVQSLRLSAGLVAEGPKGAVAISLNQLKSPDPNEPASIAKMVSELGLKHVVITSVTRDDLPDEGAGQFAAVIKCIKPFMVSLSNHEPFILRQAHQDERTPVQDDRITIEILTPDFHAREDCLKTVCEAGPQIFNHNIETTKRLTPSIRSHALYNRSLAVLKWVASNYPQITVKSGIMVGLGEREEEIVETLRDLCKAGTSIVTIGQYLRPSKKCLPVVKYISEEEFKRYKVIGESLGLKYVFSGAFVRSSYMADTINNRNKEVP